MDESNSQLSTDRRLKRKASAEEQSLARKKTSNPLSVPSHLSNQVQNDFRGPINAEMVNANARDVNIHTTEIKICPSLNPAKRSVQQLFEDETELKSALRSAAEVEAGEVSIPVKLERALVPVPLRMSNAPSRIPDEEDTRGHFTRRNEMPQIFDQEHQHDISVDEIFIEAEKHATKEARRTCKSDEARQAFVKRKQKVVGVVGQAGIGKTTFLRSLICKILTNRYRHPVSYLFYIPIRKMDFSSKPKNLLQFLVRSIVPGWKHSPEADAAFLTAIAEDPDTLIAFDGLDEADVQRFGEKVPNVNMYEESSTWAFLINIIGGNLLPLAYKVVTSRPNQMYSLHLSKRPLFLAEILGLDSVNQIDLGKQICGDRYPEIKAVLERNDNLRAMCYVPVNCILSVAFLLEIEDDLDFVSFTRVLAFTCGRYARSDHLHGTSPELTKLAKFAWETYEQRRYRFMISELREAGLSNETIHAFLHFAVVDSTDLRVTILDGDKLSYFSHMVMHEFFAGAFLMLLMSDEDFSRHVALLSEDQYEVVARFAFGLCNRTVLSSLRPFFTFKSLERKGMLTKSLLTTCENTNSESLSKILSWINEAHDDEVTQTFADALPENIELRGSFLPTDSSNLTYFLQTSSRLHDVTLSSCEFRGGSFERFAQLIVENEIKIKKLNVNNTKIGNAASEPLSRCVNCVESLVILSCGITDIKLLCENMAALPQPLKLVNITVNEIGNTGLKDLSSCLHSILELNLVRCGISNISLLADSIASVLKPMTLLVSDNNIGSEGARDLARCAHKLEVLRLFDCDIADGLEPLTESIAGLKKQMGLLSLQNNPITNASVQPLADCIHNLEELELDNCHITDISPLTKGIESLTMPMTYLSLSGNKIGNSGAEQLSTCVHHIEELHLDDCNISDISRLVESVSRLRKAMNCLCLNQNPIGNQGAAALEKCVHNIKDLMLTSCSISKLDALARGIAAMQDPMTRLAISSNPIGDDGLRALMPCLDKIGEVNYGGDCGISPEAEAEMQSKLEEMKL